MSSPTSFGITRVTIERTSDESMVGIVLVVVYRLGKRVVLGNVGAVLRDGI